MLGEQLLSGVALLEGQGLQVVRHHHERWDGAGYPDGLAGDEIPLGARIFAVADALDAMTSDRRTAGRSQGRGLARNHPRVGSQFDPAVVDAFRDRNQHLAGESTTSWPPTSPIAPVRCLCNYTAQKQWPHPDLRLSSISRQVRPGHGRCLAPDMSSCLALGHVPFGLPARARRVICSGMAVESDKQSAVDDFSTLEELQLAARNHGMPLEALRYDSRRSGCTTS